MAIIAGASGANIKPIETGVYIARCFSMIHIGTIPGEYQGVPNESDKVQITFELPLELEVFNQEKGPQPRVISREFTLSLGTKANLRTFLKNWRGKDFTDEEAAAFDISKLLGVPCQLNITHRPPAKNGRVYAEISGITPLMRGVDCPSQVNPSFEFSVNNFDQDKFNTLPKFIQEKIQSSKEYKELKGIDVHQEDTHEQTQAEEDLGLPF